MPFLYDSGESILKGDNVVFRGEPATIEFVLDDPATDPALAWYFEQYGAGVMVFASRSLSRAFLTQPHLEHLSFIARKG